jgi:peroxin-13
LLLGVEKHLWNKTRLSYLAELQPTVRGWLLASINGGQKTGLIPANYVKIIGKRRGKNSVDPTRTGSQLTSDNKTVQQPAETDLAEQFDVASSRIFTSGEQ